jgi:hypothetical protein
MLLSIAVCLYLARASGKTPKPKADSPETDLEPHGKPTLVPSSKKKYPNGHT